MRNCPERFVFIDETSIDETSVKANMTRLRGRGKKGKRLYGSAPFGRWQTQTFIAGLTCEALVAPSGDRRHDGPRRLRHLHRDPTRPRPAAALKKRRCWMLFLPAYSPDLNPIEMAVSKLKSHLRRIGARTFDQLINAIGDICSLYPPEECWNFFRAANYVPD